MFNVEELACRNDFDVRFSPILDIHNQISYHNGD